MGKNKPIRLGRGFTPVWITVCLTEVAWKKATRNIKKGVAGDFPAHLHAACTQFEPGHMKSGIGPVCIITISPKYLKTGWTVASLVAHEAVHCKQFCERIMSTTFDHETEAYYVQHITAAIMRKIKRYRK